MPTFEVKMRVTYIEVWSVEAEDEKEARFKVEELADDVETDDGMPELVDFEISSLKMEPSE